MNDLPEVVQGWLGQPVVAVEHVITVERGLWMNFCAAVGDGNPLYWDHAVARHHTGAVIAPPAMLPSWAVEHDWYPGKTGQGLRTLELHFMVKEAIGLPHGIVTEVEFEYHEPVKAGDSVRAEQVLKEVGKERMTRLGPGRNWTIEVVYRRQDGVLLGIQTLRFLAYRKE